MKTPFKDFFRSGAFVFATACVLLGIAAWQFHKVSEAHKSDLEFHTRQLKDDEPRQKIEEGMFVTLAMIAATNAPIRELLLNYGYMLAPDEKYPGHVCLKLGPRMGVHP